mgnify:CR=1 FL=1
MKIEKSLNDLSDSELKLLDDIAWGRAGEDHLPALADLSAELIAEKADERAFLRLEKMCRDRFHEVAIGILILVDQQITNSVLPTFAQIRQVTQQRGRQ